MSWTFQTLLQEIQPFGAAAALVSVAESGTQTLSYADLVQEVRSLAAGLIRVGIGPQTAVGLVAPNGIPWAVARLALGAAGAITVALDDAMSSSELRPLLAASTCRHVFCSASHARALRSADPTLGVTVIGGEAPPAGARSWNELFGPADGLPAVASSAPAMVLYTSGTTGPAKRFFLSCDQLSANLHAVVAAHLVGEGDRVLLPLPLHHIYPLAIGLLVPLLSGSAVVFPENSAGAHIRDALRSAEISTVVGVPRLYSALVAGVSEGARASGKTRAAAFSAALRAAGSIRKRFGLNVGRPVFRRVRAKIAPRLTLLVSGGARLDTETLWFLAALGFEVRTGYGLAETASVFAANIPGSERFGSEGKPLGDGRLRIADEEEAGIGEIQLRGPAVFTGYEDNPAANREAFTPDGWFRTGDLGRVDPNGFLFVTGRTKERIVLGGGKKIFPEELEQYYGDSPYIQELAVLEYRGALVALIVPDFDAARRDGLARIDETIRVHLSSRGQNLASYRRLAGYRLTREPLPRTRLGKYQRFRLPRLYEDAAVEKASSSPVRLQPPEDPLLEQASARSTWDILATRYASKALSLDSSLLLDLGIDSLEWVTLGLLLEERLGVRLTDAELAQDVTVRDLLQSVLKAPPRASSEGLPPVQTVPTERGLFEMMVVPLLYGVNSLVLHLFFCLHVRGADRLPPQGPFVLAANHASDLDALALAAALGLGRVKETYWAAAPSRLLAKPWMQPLLRAMHVFPVRERAAAQSLEAAETLLRRGKIVVWFPEAWRTPDGQLQRFHAGIGQLLTRARVPAIPVHISGSFEAWPRHRRLPRLRRIEVSVGAPIASVAAMTDAQTIADAIHDAVAELS